MLAAGSKATASCAASTGSSRMAKYATAAMSRATTE